MILLEVSFWLAVVGVGYAYFGYPAVLWLWSQLAPRPVRHSASPELPPITMLIPVHNEAALFEQKLSNTLALEYPRELLQVLVVSDGSTDATNDIAAHYAETYGIEFDALPERGGKAGALNRGLALARGDIVVFSDCSIMLQADGLRQIVAPFVDPEVGCVSGEDHIPEVGGEGLYGRYELWLRSLESRVSSIVGASGSFYAQRRFLCSEFPAGMAPDFYSALMTVEQGYRAITWPAAQGRMRATASPEAEYERKVRTLVRGMTLLRFKAGLLNPLRYKGFAFVLLSHKLLRWLVPVFMLAALVVNALLVTVPFYLATFVLQIVFYGLALGAWFRKLGLGDTLPGRIAAYFCAANVAIAHAWAKFLSGQRQEIWEPTRRMRNV